MDVPSLTFTHCGHARGLSPGSPARFDGQAQAAVHIDLETDNVEAEAERLEKLGAVRWDHQQERGFDFWVFQDPWGNEFCVLQEEFPELLARRRP